MAFMVADSHKSSVYKGKFECIDRNRSNDSIICALIALGLSVIDAVFSWYAFLFETV